LLWFQARLQATPEPDPARQASEARAQLATQSMEVIKAGPTEFGAFINSEIARWGALIRTNHIVIN